MPFVRLTTEQRDYPNAPFRVVSRFELKDSQNRILKIEDPENLFPVAAAHICQTPGVIDSFVCSSDGAALDIIPGHDSRGRPLVRVTVKTRGDAHIRYTYEVR